MPPGDVYEYLNRTPRASARGVVSWHITRCPAPARRGFIGLLFGRIWTYAGRGLVRIQGGACRDSPPRTLGLLRDRARISEAGARGGRSGPGSGTVEGKRPSAIVGGEAQTVSSPFYFHILLPPVWVDGGVLVWLGLFCGRIGGLDDVPVSGAGQNAVHDRAQIC